MGIALAPYLQRPDRFGNQVGTEKLKSCLLNSMKNDNPKNNLDLLARDVSLPDNNGAEDNRLATDGGSDPFDPFDPVNLRIDQSFLNRGAAKKLLTTVPVRKPNKQDFVRVHPSEAYRATVALIELQEEREIYLLQADLLHELNETEYYLATLYLGINRQKVLFLWPVKLPSPDGRQNSWHISAADAAERAMKQWIRMTANMSLRAYEIFETEGNFGQPEWPELPMRELLRIGFKSRYIDTAEHPVVQKLRGVI